MLYKNEEYERAVTEFTLAVRGATADGVAVQGLPLAPAAWPTNITPSTAGRWCAWAAAPKRLSFSVIIQNIAADQLAYYNATEGINFCQGTLEEPEPEATAIPDMNSSSAENLQLSPGQCAQPLPVLFWTLPRPGSSSGCCCAVSGRSAVALRAHPHPHPHAAVVHPRSPDLLEAGNG
jgi:hypothetical protein